MILKIARDFSPVPHQGFALDPLEEFSKQLPTDFDQPTANFLSASLFDQNMFYAFSFIYRITLSILQTISICDILHIAFATYTWNLRCFWKIKCFIQNIHVMLLK